MKRFFLRIFSFFWSWGFLKFVLISITLVILLYVEEDWRGARAWAATKAKWEARGVSFDFNTYLPPPVPDDQNLAALPLFKLEPDPDPDSERHGYPVPLALRRAFSHDQTNSLENRGDWQNGRLFDMKSFRTSVAAQYGAVFPGRAPPAGASAQFAELYPVVAELRGASVARPLCRFENYRLEPSEQNQLGLITEQIQVSKFLTWDALLALDARDTDRALDDIKLNNKIVRALMDQPVLVSGLVAIGMTAIDFGAVYQGLATHAWSDAQMGELEVNLGRLDFTSDYHGLMHGEAIEFLIPSLDQVKEQGSVLWHKKDGIERKSYFPTVWPSGWIDLWKVRSVDLELTASEWADPESRRFRPEAIAKYQAETDKKLNSWTVYLPWNWLFRLGANDYVFNTPHKFAEMQVWVDEARIACALERYRLAHNSYPPTLDALVPACIDELPHDVMNGEPYHYRLRTDGTFLLYSVGWNQRNDGGVEVMEDNVRDYNKGDWVWPTPKASTP
jgi:hypothetical protein